MVIERHRPAQAERTKFDKNKKRKTRQQEGLGARWQRIRARQLRLFPVCQWPGCEIDANEVDHIWPRRLGGTHDDENLQSLCKSHHSYKTATLDGGFGRESQFGRRTSVSIVCGPPGSGKTTFVKHHMMWGDLVLDLDALYRALSQLSDYERPVCLLPFVESARDAIYHRLTRDSELRHAWVITTQPSARERRMLAQRLRAETIVLEISAVTCLSRIATDERRAEHVEKWDEHVSRWWAEYTRSAREITIDENMQSALVRSTRSNDDDDRD